MKNVTLAQPGTKKEIIHISAKTEKINGIVQGDVDNVALNLLKHFFCQRLFTSETETINIYCVVSVYKNLREQEKKNSRKFSKYKEI